MLNIVLHRRTPSRRTPSIGVLFLLFLFLIGVKCKDSESINYGGDIRNVIDPQGEDSEESEKQELKQQETEKPQRLNLKDWIANAGEILEYRFPKFEIKKKKKRKKDVTKFQVIFLYSIALIVINYLLKITFYGPCSLHRGDKLHLNVILLCKAILHRSYMKHR